MSVINLSLDPNSVKSNENVSVILTIRVCRDLPGTDTRSLRAKARVTWVFCRSACLPVSEARWGVLGGTLILLV